MVEKVLEYVHTHEGYDDIPPLCESALSRLAIPPKSKDGNEEIAGFVYLLKSGRFYKIGRTNAHGRREYELALQLPEKVRTIHVISTDDPIGIEAYWHNRFADKRKNGEWFDLDAADVAAFKRRKFM